METPDPLTVKLNLVAPDSSLLAVMRGAGPLVSPAAVQKWGDDFERHVVSAGPFELEKYVPDTELVFKRFDGYFGKDKDGNKLPYLDRITVRIIADATVGISSLESGDVDVVPSLGATMASRVEGNRDLSLIVNKRSNLSFLSPRFQDAPADNLDLRKALAYAIDRDELVKAVYDGRGAPATSVLPESMKFWFDPTVQGYKYDAAKAKEYLTKAGYPNGVQLKVVVYAGMKDLATAVQAQLRRVGIDMVVDVVDIAVFGKAFRDPSSVYAFSVLVYGQYVDPIVVLYPFFGATGIYNVGNKQKVAEVEDLLLKGRATYDANERKAVYNQLQRVLIDRLYIIPLVNSDTFAATRTYVKGYYPGPMGYGDAKMLWLNK